MSVQLRIFVLLLPLVVAACFKKYDETGGSSNRFDSAPVGASTTLPFCVVGTAFDGWLTQRNFLLEFECKPPAAAPEDLVESVHCRTSQSPTWVECDSRTEHLFTGLGDGSLILEIRAASRNNRIGRPVRFSLKVDATPPTIEEFSLDSIVNNVPILSVRAEDDASGSGIDRLMCRVVGPGASGAWYSCGDASTQSIQLNNLQAQQNYTAYVKAADRAGNESSVASVNFDTDFIPPQESCVISPVPQFTRLQSISIDYSCSSEQSIASYECRINDAPWTQCQSSNNHQISGLSEGSQKFRVRFKNEHGMNSPVSQVNWIVDLTEPNIQITKADIDGLSAHFEYSVSDNYAISRVECAVNKVGSPEVFSACSQSYSVEGLEAGSDYRFSVRAVDKAGNINSKQYTWSTHPPEGLPVCSILTSFPNSYSLHADTTISFSCSSPHGATSFPRCRVSGEDWEDCSSINSHVILGLEDAQNTQFCVKTFDKWSRQSSPSCVSWTVSLLGPQMGGLAVDVAHPFAQLLFNAEDSSCPVSHFQCRLEGDGPAHNWKNCQSPQLYSGLELHKYYNFSVRAHTLCGQVSEEKTVSWQSRSYYEGPSCHMEVASGQEWSAVSPIEVVFVCDDNATPQNFECSLDGDTWELCQGTSQNPYLVEGSQTGTVHRYIRATDEFDLTGPTSQKSFKFDFDDPSVSDISLSWQGTDRLDVFFKAKDIGSGIDQIECQIDALSAWFECSSPLELTHAALFEPGAEHTIRIRATDRSGRVSPDASYTWRNGQWSDWGSCEAQPDGSGLQHRSCSSPEPLNSGLSCQGSAVETCADAGTLVCTNLALDYPACSQCATGYDFAEDQVCRPKATNGGWSAWGACSVSCGGGFKLRSCAQPKEAYSHSDCYEGQAKQGTWCNTQTCCLPAGTYLGIGDVPGYSPDEITCQSDQQPDAVTVNDASMGCCSGRVVYSDPQKKNIVTCGPGTNCDWCPAYVPGQNQPNYNWDDWYVHCD